MSELKTMKYVRYEDRRKLGEYNAIYGLIVTNRIIKYLQKENVRLNNIINYIWQLFENGSFEDGCDCIEIYDYLKQLKGGK